MTAPTARMLNIGAKSGAWLRQVGLRTHDDLAAVGALEAYLRVKRAGFKPSLNLLYALEGALMGCHWQQVEVSRRAELAALAQAEVAKLPVRGRPPTPSDVIVTIGEIRTQDPSDDEPHTLSF